MNRYLATFHTHLAALRTHRALSAQGMEARMMPVPRAVSSSCGTCVCYTAEHEMRSCMDADAEHIYLSENGGFTLLYSFEELIL